MTAAPLPPSVNAHERPAPPSRGWRRVLRLITVLHDWAESGWSKSATAAWGVLQGSVVPGPADGLLIPLGLADPRRAYTLALWALAGSIAGAMGAYLLGAHAFDDIGRALLAWVGVGARQLQESRALFDRYGGTIIAVSALLPIPTKMMCIAAGVFGVPFAEFALGITAGRAVRFLAVATALRYAGEGMLRWIQSRTKASDA
jgi:membrane protein YqaA with SNARE-associated domain